MKYLYGLAAVNGEPTLCIFITYATGYNYVYRIPYPYHNLSGKARVKAMIHKSEYLLRTCTNSSTSHGQGYNKEAFFIVLSYLWERLFYMPSAPIRSTNLSILFKIYLFSARQKGDKL